MAYRVDLHIHSKYSRATSRDCDLEHLSLWARRKGLAVLGTGDFTHPAWRQEIRDKLVPAEPGLWRLRPDLEREVERRAGVPAPATRFLLSVEISTIYKKGDKTRKVHHLVFAPDLAAADRIVAALARIGNLHSDGRPILGLDSRHLLEIVLAAGPGCHLIPAHVWTPWFSVLGSKSGFDDVADCYGDLAGHVFAIETGLSSDPAMNWRLSSLDRYTLISSSDAHSPEKLGREALVVACELDYHALFAALATRDGYAGTVEFFPEEGKYHLDGHRACGVVLEPSATRAADGRCPACGRPLTVGVLHRVEELADRPASFVPDGAAPFRSLVPLPEVLAEIAGTGPTSKTVRRDYDALVGRLGAELDILEHAPLEDVARASSQALVEALRRMRAGEVVRRSGYDGEYGVIRLFSDGELGREAAETIALPGLEAPAPAAPRRKKPRAQPAALAPGLAAPTAVAAPVAAAGAGILAGLDDDQRAAAALTEGAVLVVAGPGTGKTRTLTHRIAHLVAGGAAPEACLAVTFTQRAAAEMRERLEALLPAGGAAVPVLTFHALALAILREARDRAGLARGFRVASDDERAALLIEALGVDDRKARKLLAAISETKRARCPADGDLAAALAAHEAALEVRALIDFDDLLLRATDLLEAEADLRVALRERWRWISIDEYQDIDALQYQLMRLLCPADGHLFAIGDPDQAIYAFRGADVGFFLRFAEDFPGARRVQLGRNYRSSRTIVDAACQAIAPATLVPDRILTAMAEDRRPIEVMTAPTERAEAERVAHTIESLVGGTSLFSIDSGRVHHAGDGAVRFSDFAVLYRMEAQGDALAEALGRAGIPLQRRSHRRLVDRPEVRALAERLADAPPGALADRVRAAARAAAADPGLAAAVLELIAPLVDRAGDDADAFVSSLALAADVDALDPRADRVSLLTLHAAKGLEFRVVFVVGCEDGLVPLRFGGDADDLDEERRLFFVAMTRARERLYLTRSQRRAPSPFLRDIEERLLYERIAELGPRRAEKAEQLALF